MRSHPILDNVRRNMPSLSCQPSSLEECRDSAGSDYILDSSNYGINETISLPTFTVILRHINSTSVRRVINEGRKIFDPSSFSTCLVRFIERTFRYARNILYYLKVPAGLPFNDNRIAQLPIAI